MQFHVELRVAGEPALQHRHPQLLADRPQFGDLLVAGAVSGFRRAEAVEHPSALVDRDRLGYRHDPNASALVGHSLDEPLRREIDERGAHAGSVDAEHLSQVRLDQPLARHEFSPENGASYALDRELLGRLSRRAFPLHSRQPIACQRGRSLSKIKSRSFRTVAGGSGRSANPAQQRAGRDGPPSQGITTIFLPGEETCACPRLRGLVQRVGGRRQRQRARRRQGRDVPVAGEDVGRLLRLRR